MQTIIRSFENLKIQLDKEKRAFKRIWAAREKMLEQAIDSSAALYGDIETIAGEPLLQLDGFGLEEAFEDTGDLETPCHSPES